MPFAPLNLLTPNPEPHLHAVAVHVRLESLRVKRGRNVVPVHMERGVVGQGGSIGD